MATTTGQKKIQLDDIASELSLSKSTVSRAISGKGRISDETRARVQQYIKERNYRPNVIARSLAQSKTFNLGVVLPADKELSDIPFFQTCLLGVCETAASKDYDVVVTTATQDNITLVRRLIENNKVDGVIITRSVVNDLTIKYLKEASVPFVIIGSTDESGVVQIDTDHVSACCEMTSYLLAQNAPGSSLGLIMGSMGHVVNKSRYEGFKRAFNSKNLIPDEKMIFTDMVTKAAIETACLEIIKHRPQCIVCGDDYICTNLINVINRIGLVVPNDVKIASFYNSVFLKNSNPPVTAVSIDVKELGSVAGMEVIRLINGESAPEKTLLSYELSIKRSSM